MRGLRATSAVVLTTAFLLASACDGEPRPSSCGSDSRGPVTFATVKDLSTPLRDFLQGRWKTTHPKEPLTIVTLPASADEQRGQLAATLQTARRSGGGYDVVGLDLVFIPEFASAGYLYPLDGHRFPRGDYLDQSWESSSYGGQLYAAPFTANVGLLYYWADELVRLEVVKSTAERWQPRKWDDVATVAQRSLLDSGDRRAGYAGQLAQYEGLTVNLLELIWGFEGRLPDRGSTVDGEQRANGTAGLRFLINGIGAGWIKEESLDFREDEAQDAFAKQQAVILRHWPDAWAQLSETAKNSEEGTNDLPMGSTIGVTRLPGPSVLGGESVAVAACSVHRSSAQDLVRFLTSDEAQRELFNQGLFLPTRTHLYRDGSLTGPAASPPPPGFVALLFDSLNDAKPRPVVPDYLGTSQQLQNEVHRQLEGAKEKTVDPSALFDRVAETFSQAQ